MHFRTLGISLLAALVFCAPANAQDDVTEITFARESPCVRASRIESEVPCFEERAPESAGIELNVENVTSVEYFSVPTRQCQAIVTLDYKQKNSLVSVEGAVDNQTCGASNGSFALSIRTTHNSGEQASHEFMHAWERDDDQPVKFSAEYPIEEDVILLVRAQRVRCTCAEAP